MTIRAGVVRVHVPAPEEVVPLHQAGDLHPWILKPGEELRLRVEELPMEATAAAAEPEADLVADAAEEVVHQAGAEVAEVHQHLAREGAVAAGNFLWTCKVYKYRISSRNCVNSYCWYYF